MMIGSKGLSDALARSLETLIDPPNISWGQNTIHVTGVT